MATLSQTLGDLAVQIGDLEARAEAFRFESAASREQKIKEMRRAVATQQSKQKALLYATGGEISTAWSWFDRSMRERAEAIQTQIPAETDAVGAARDAHQTDRLECHARLAIAFAVIAVSEAELAVAEAISAGLCSERLSGRATD